MGAGRWACSVIDAGLDARTRIAQAVDLRDSITRGVGRASWGAAGLARETSSGRHVIASGVSPIVVGAVRVGNGIAHGDSDRTVALVQLSAGFDDLRADLDRVLAHEDPSSPRAIWMAQVFEPALAEWRQFAAAERGSWLTRFATSWDTFVDWSDRLRRLREAALLQGIALSSAPPKALPATLSEQGAAGTGSPLAILWTAVKVILYAAGALAGFVGLYTIVRDLRHGANPLQRMI